MRRSGLQFRAMRAHSCVRPGSSVSELANQFGIHRSTVSIVLERRGVSRRYNLLEGVRLQRAADLYIRGKSLDEIGR